MDDLQIKTRVLSSLVEDVRKGLYNYDTALQRKANQWNTMQKSLLIDSAVRNYPIYPVLVNKQDGSNQLEVIDFKQRLTTLASYCNDDFSLSKKLNPVVIDGVEYIIAGKKFSKLDDVIKNRFNNREIQEYIMLNASDEEQREIFERINGGKPLSNSQLRTTVESEEMRKVIHSLISHPFFDKVLTPNQRKKDADKEIVRQTLMLTETTREDDKYASFKSKDINAFIEEYQQNINHTKIDCLIKGLNGLNNHFEELKVKQLHLPMILYTAYRCSKDQKSFTKLENEIKSFLETYETNEEYKQFCNNGVNNKANVVGRLTYWRAVIRRL